MKMSNEDQMMMNLAYQLTPNNGDDKDTSKDAAKDAAQAAAEDAANDAANDVEDKDAAKDESVASLMGLQRSQEILLMILNYEV